MAKYEACVTVSFSLTVVADTDDEAKDVVFDFVHQRAPAIINDVEVHNLFIGDKLDD